MDKDGEEVVDEERKHKSRELKLTVPREREGMLSSAYQQMAAYWRSFAKYGNPNTAKHRGAPEWPACKHCGLRSTQGVS